MRIAIEAMELIYNSDVDVIALATRDADFLPIINEAKRRGGKETIVVGVEPGFSVASRTRRTTSSRWRERMREGSSNKLFKPPLSSPPFWW